MIYSYRLLIFINYSGIENTTHINNFCTISELTGIIIIIIMGILKGKVKINDFRMTKSDFAIINDSEKIKINSLSNSKIFEIKSPTNPSYATYF